MNITKNVYDYGYGISFWDNKDVLKLTVTMIAQSCEF